MLTWEEIRAWRKITRLRLLAERQALPVQERERIGARVRATVLELLDGRLPHTLGIYWPIKGEMNFVPLAEAVLAAGGRVGLPVVVQKAAPVEFWSWRRGERLVRGAWDIPVPKLRDLVQPELLIVPLVGFDAQGYRLGYGAGFYDRTLAAAVPRPRTIAVGFSTAQLDTIHPQPHDVPMDQIVTEHGNLEIGEKDMNSARRTVLNLGVAALAAMAAMAVMQPAFADTRADVEAATAQWIDAFNRKSATDIVKLYAPDAVFLGTSSPVIRDSPALVAEYFQSLATLGDASNAVGEHRVQLFGDVAINSGYYTLTRTVDGKTTQSPARFSFVYQKRGGKWLIVSHHSSAFPQAR